jgi:hypothetical protein
MIFRAEDAHQKRRYILTNNQNSEIVRFVLGEING